MSQSKKVLVYREELEQLLHHLYDVRRMYVADTGIGPVRGKTAQQPAAIRILNLWIDRIAKILKWR